MDYPTFVTDRLTVRPFRLTDAPAYFRLFADEDVARVMPRTLHSTIEQTEAKLRTVHAKVESGLAMRWTVVLRSADEPIGLVGFGYIDRENRNAWVAYELERAYWGQGLMSEALTPVVAHGFGELNLHRLAAHVNRQNVRSQRFIEKFGFEREGVLRGDTLFGAEFRDTVIYAQTRVRVNV